EGLARDRDDLVLAAIEQALDRVGQLGGLARHLDVGDRVHVEGDAAARVRARHLQLDRHVGQVHAVDALEHGQAHAAPALHDAIADHALVGVRHRAVAAREDEDLVGRADVDHARDDDRDHDEGERDRAAGNQGDLMHDVLLPQPAAGRGASGARVSPATTLATSTPRVVATWWSSAATTCG